jgi:hypothetical protein
MGNERKVWALPSYTTTTVKYGGWEGGDRLQRMRMHRLRGCAISMGSCIPITVPIVSYHTGLGGIKA